MNGKKSDAWIFPEDRLRAIAMVDVEIDDQHAIQAEFRDRRRRPNGHVVQDAEAHRLAGQGVMSGGTHQAQCGLVFATNHTADRVDYGSGGQCGNVETTRPANGIRIQIAAAGTCEGPNLLDIGRVVNPCQAAPITRFGRGLPALGGQPRSIEMRFHRSQPQRAFRMAARLVVQKPRVSIKESHGFPGKLFQHWAGGIGVRPVGPVLRQLLIYTRWESWASLTRRSSDSALWPKGPVV